MVPGERAAPAGRWRLAYGVWQHVPVVKRAGRFRSASRGRLPGFSLLPLTVGIVADQFEGIARQLRVTLCRARRPVTFEPARAGYPVVVPIAGVFERWEHLLPILRHLNGIGFGVHVIEGLGRNLDGVEQLAGLVLDDLARHDLRGVALLGHSKGGIVGKLALLRDGEAGRVHHLVALSTPFKGSRVAAFARSIELAALSPASRQTVKLSRRTEVDHRITSIYATFDEVVAVSTQVALGTNIEVVRIGHHTVLSSREVAEHVALELARVYGLPPRLDPGIEPWYRRLTGRKRDLVRDYGFAVGWQLRSVLPDGRRLERWQRGGAAGRPPIVLLPGVLERWHFMSVIAERLHRAGYPVHVVRSLGINRRGAPQQAEHVGAFLAERDLRDAIVVAHSKGGLIGKFAMLHREVGERIAGMVAVATPFNGSPYARFFLDPSIREFSPTNRVIRSLAVEREVNARIVSIWPAFDQHIPTTSWLPGARANIELPGTGHFRILSSRAVVDAVLRHVEAIASGAEAPGVHGR